MPIGIQRSRCPQASSQSRLYGQGQLNGRRPAAEEEGRDQRRDDEEVDVLGEVEEAETHARVLGGEAGHDLGVGLGHVERRAVGLGRGGDEEDHQREGLLEGEPVEGGAATGA